MSVLLSRYAASLNPTVKARYLDKIKVIGNLDPYQMRLKENEIPDTVSTGRVVDYLTTFQSPYTGTPDKNTRSAEAYEKFLDGFLAKVTARRVGRYYVIVGKVAHSMKLDQAYLTPWIIVQEDGIISSAHCTCVAGLSETCSHVSTVLYALANRHYLRHVQKITVTDLPCSWMRPGKKIRDDLYNAIEAIDYGYTVNKFCEEYGPRKSYEDYKLFLKELNDSGSQSAIIRHLCGEGDLTCASCSASHIPDKILVNPNILLQNNFRIVYEMFSIDDLRVIASTMHFVITNEQIEIVEKLTREQTTSKLWFWARTGRVTASIMKKCISTSSDEPPVKRSLLRTISFPQDHQFETAATQYGKKHEGEAKKCLPLVFKGHANLEITTETGLHIFKEHPFIAASPDALVRCQCCGIGVVEIKCPYRLSRKCHLGQVLTIDDLTRTVNPFITKQNQLYYMVPTHDYYYQVQTQIFVVGADYGLFLVWSEDEILSIRVEKDFDLWNNCLMKSKLFFDRIILPEILGNHYLKDELFYH